MKRRHLSIGIGMVFVVAAASAQQAVTTNGGSDNVLSKYSGAATIVSSAIYENGGSVGIGTRSPTATLTVNGGLSNNSRCLFSNIFRFYTGNADGKATNIDFRSQTGNLYLSAPGTGRVILNYEHGTGGVYFGDGQGHSVANIGASGNAQFLGTGASLFAGSLGIGVAPSSRLTVNGVIQSTSGGIKFPDNTIQTTAATGGSTTVHTDNTTIGGNGSTSAPLHVQVPLRLYVPLSGVNGTVFSVSTGAGGDAIYGTTISGAGVHGVGTHGPGVFGEAALAAGAIAVQGSANGSASNGVVGSADGTDAVGISGSATGAASLAGLFSGDVQVTGNLSKAGGSFRIDHPLDPANKYLSHSFVESPDMKNIYDGIAFTDATGTAVVSLPDWFEALNRDFRYQLTVIGQFAQAVVSNELVNNVFVIKSDRPHVKVSWQVTGIRQDAWANAHRIPVEEDKPDSERGSFLHPELYDEPASKSEQWARHPDLMLRIQQAQSVAHQ